MKRFSEQFYTKAKSVKLQAVEREELRNRVRSYMEYHPIAGVVKTAGEKGVSEERFQYIGFNLPFGKIARFSAATAAIVLIVVPVLAEKAVPGDSLYAVKVRFNEEVISTLQLTPYEKVEWETERLNRRIAEAKLLATEGKLTDEVEAEIAAAVQQHTESVEESIEALRENDADQATLASMELSTTLQMQSETLQEGAVVAQATDTDTSDTNAQRQKLADVINASITKQEGNEFVIPPFEKIMARVEVNTTRAYELLESKASSKDEPQHNDIARRLEDVNRTIERANALRGEDEAVARQTLLEALVRSKKIIVFLSATGNGNIETVVPIEYTDEEYKQQFGTLNDEVNRKVEIVKMLSPKASPDAAEKAAYAVEIAQNNQKTAASSTEPAGAVHLLQDGISVLDDMLRIFESEGVNAHTVTPPVTEPVTEVVATSSEAIESSEGEGPSN